jgi:hypothetical protein
MSEKSIGKMHKDKKVFRPIMYKVHKPPGPVPTIVGIGYLFGENIS